MENKIDKIYKGILQAKIQEGLYNVDTNEIQNPETAIRYCLNSPNCRMDYQLRLVGRSDEIQNNISGLNAKIIGLKQTGLGEFFRLGMDKNVFLKIMFKLSPDDIIALCGSSKEFAEKCRSFSVYEKLTEDLFPKAKKVSEDSKDNFEILWNTRISIDEFQATNEAKFENHPDDVEKIFDTIQTEIEILHKAGKNASIVSSFSVVDVIILQQYPRKQIYEKYGMPLELLDVFETVDNPDYFEDALEKLSSESGVDFEIPYEDEGIDQATYIRLLDEILPPPDLERDKWILQLNENLIERIQTIAEEDEEDDDIELLIKLSSLQSKDPYMIWVLRPDILSYIDVLVEKWQMLLDQRLLNFSEDEIFERFTTYTFFNERYENGEDIWYVPDFNMILEPRQFSALEKDNLLRDEEIDQDDHVICDSDRWNNWRNRFAVYSE
jgi:hypothetical protein